MNNLNEKTRKNILEDMICDLGTEIYNTKEAMKRVTDHNTYFELEERLTYLNGRLDKVKEELENIEKAKRKLHTKHNVKEDLKFMKRQIEKSREGINHFISDNELYSVLVDVKRHCGVSKKDMRVPTNQSIDDYVSEYYEKILDEYY
jgi:predicted  nucleic acid-binding Zn-ribbon protein